MPNRGVRPKEELKKAGQALTQLTKSLSDPRLGSRVKQEPKKSLSAPVDVDDEYSYEYSEEEAALPVDSLAAFAAESSDSDEEAEPQEPEPLVRPAKKSAPVEVVPGELRAKIKAMKEENEARKEAARKSKEALAQKASSSSSKMRNAFDVPNTSQKRGQESRTVFEPKESPRTVFETRGKDIPMSTTEQLKAKLMAAKQGIQQESAPKEPKRSKESRRDDSDRDRRRRKASVELRPRSGSSTQQPASGSSGFGYGGVRAKTEDRKDRDRRRDREKEKEREREREKEKEREKEREREREREKQKEKEREKEKKDRRDKKDKDRKDKDRKEKKDRDNGSASKPPQQWGFGYVATPYGYVPAPLPPPGSTPPPGSWKTSPPPPKSGSKASQAPAPEPKRTPQPKMQAAPLMPEGVDLALWQAEQQKDQVHSKAASKAKTEVMDPHAKDLAEQISQDLLDMQAQERALKEQRLALQDKIEKEAQEKLALQEEVMQRKVTQTTEEFMKTHTEHQLALRDEREAEKAEKLRKETEKGSDSMGQYLEKELEKHQKQELQLVEDQKAASQMKTAETVAIAQADEQDKIDADLAERVLNAPNMDFLVKASTSNMTPMTAAEAAAAAEKEEKERATKMPKGAVVCTIGWLPSVEAQKMVTFLTSYRVDTIIDARPTETIEKEDFASACAANGVVYDKQPVLSIHPSMIGPGHGAAIHSLMGRVSKAAKAAAANDSDGSCAKTCILFAGEQKWPDECHYHVMMKLRSVQVKTFHISLDIFWEKSTGAFNPNADDEEEGVVVGRSDLTAVVEDLTQYAGLSKGHDDKNKQLMVSARAGLEAWVARRFQRDRRLQMQQMPPEATLKDRIDVLKDNCPELVFIADTAHMLRMVGNFSAHNPGAIIPEEWELVKLVQKLTQDIKQADSTFEAGEKERQDDPFAPCLSMLTEAPDPSLPEPLSQSVVRPKDGIHQGTLIFLHPFGYGNTRYLNQFASKGIRIVLPMAPKIPIMAYENQPFVSWYDYFPKGEGVSELEADACTLEDMRVRLAMTLETEAALLGPDGHRRLIVGGLGQGGSTALHTVLMHRKQLAGYIGVCTQLLSCTPPAGPGRLTLHLFGHWQDEETWGTDTRDELMLYHDVVDHGNVFGLGSGPFDINKIDKTLEADCLRTACESLLDMEESTSAERVALAAAKQFSSTFQTGRVGPAQTAASWADERLPRLQDQLAQIRLLHSRGARKAKLRSLQLELHPDKQPPERREQAQSMFLLVQKEWEELAPAKPAKENDPEPEPAKPPQPPPTAGPPMDERRAFFEPKTVGQQAKKPEWLKHPKNQKNAVQGGKRWDTRIGAWVDAEEPAQPEQVPMQPGPVQEPSQPSEVPTQTTPEEPSPPAAGHPLKASAKAMASPASAFSMEDEILREINKLKSSSSGTGTDDVQKLAAEVDAALASTPVDMDVEAGDAGEAEEVQGGDESQDQGPIEILLSAMEPEDPRAAMRAQKDPGTASEEPDAKRPRTS
eukprot:TRINITY_DN4121_c0_g1_i1.p1 TRINITY_DN4121_c0_g1~~TRINITY_DN4121_c0_g1_i1.p1  ORF type:complete len:1501 (-),score=431.44 TRINITY_DN4121_c0_g1_i1:79-4581(-)